MVRDSFLYGFGKQRHGDTGGDGDLTRRACFQSGGAMFPAAEGMAARKGDERVPGERAELTLEVRRDLDVESAVHYFERIFKHVSPIT